MSKQLTPMQELIEYLEKYKEVIGMTAVMIIDKAKSLLPEERKMVEDAYNGGYRDGEDDAPVRTSDSRNIADCSNAADYFTQQYQS